ncbi:uncharacterized protein LOC115782576 [Archocentrus centrarchus]|uniref:uncharacterized protein LOC115782576 n=1 Tax=Archocentrus centrarchus TaxID=63155 RepID=UPI0011E9F6FE|nr:uncharacterized protein LOC115782576 [Archocentrus centrarchus]
MKHTLFCFIFLTALQDGNTGLVNAEILTSRAVEGGNITVGCRFYFSGERKLFCKEKCEDGGILVETSADAAQSGRYNIRYEKNSDIRSDHILYVSITQLKKSDSGWYRCSLDRSWRPDSNFDFEIIVTEAPTTKTPTVTLRPFSASGFLSPASTPPPTLSGSSGSGSSTPPSASAGRSDMLLYVGLTLLVMISVNLAALLIFYKKRRTTKPRGPPVETESADREDNRLYEEIRECDIPSRSPPVEVSSVYATAKDPKPGGGESMSLYSLVTSPQNKVEENSGDLSHSEVDFSHIPATCSAPCDNATDVIYSVAQVDHSRAASPPLYSTVTSA